MRTSLPSFAPLFLACALCVACLGPQATAAPPKTQQSYIRPTLNSMVDILFANGVIDPNDPRQLVDFVRVKDCSLLERYYGNDFAWNKIKTRIIAEARALQKDVPSRFVINDQLEIDRYNFKTQSFDINAQSQLKNVNLMTLLHQSAFTCQGREVNYQDRVLPDHFSFRPDVPLSLVRLPMAAGMARRILPDIIETLDNRVQKRTIYFSVFLTVDGIVGITNSTATLGGHIDRIEFFSDAERMQRIKTMLYNSF